MPSINVTPPNPGTCPVSDPEQQPPTTQEQPQQTGTGQPPVEEQQPTNIPEEQDPKQSDGTEGIRTTPIPMPGGSTQQAREGAEPTQAASGGAPQASRPAPGTGGPGMRNLVRFLNNPEGAMTNNNSDYLRTMYSTDQARLVVQSAMNSSGYY